MTRFRFTHLNKIGMAIALLLLVGTAGHAQSGGQEINYARHVAPILQEKCQICHQPNSVAPMSLLTYQDAVNYGP